MPSGSAGRAVSPWALSVYVMRLDGQNTHLEMGVPWEDKVLFVVCAFDEDAYERLEVVLHGGYLVEEPEADVGRDLVVARAARVQLASDGADDEMDLLSMICEKMT